MTKASLFHQLEDQGLQRVATELQVRVAGPCVNCPTEAVGSQAQSPGGHVAGASATLGKVCKEKFATLWLEAKRKAQGALLPN